jgi:hypothetical protein
MAETIRTVRLCRVATSVGLCQSSLPERSGIASDASQFDDNADESDEVEI